MGPSEADQTEMLATLGFASLDELVSSTVPANIRLTEPLELGSHQSEAMAETEALALLETMAKKNKVLKSMMGLGYHETHTPLVILRNMLENPGWYTAYTPYQAEISQGRLEMLLNYQTLVTELTGMEMANASLLDEATAAAEAMSMCVALSKNGKKKNASLAFFCDAQCHPQTIAVVRTRCEALDIAVVRYGVPMGFGGPHAAYMATSEKYARRMPGRIIGETVEANDRKGRALRMAMQTREQHIRRDKATSNICTAQALLANMAAAYAIYHGPEGLQAIARRCKGLAQAAPKTLNANGIDASDPAFDTIVVSGVDAASTVGDLDDLAVVDRSGERGSILPHAVFNSHRSESQMLRYLLCANQIFNPTSISLVDFHTGYLKHLEDKDLALNHSMISLGSCTMKLNATAEMIPITWPEFANAPFAPVDQTAGYVEMIDSLNADLCKITGFDAASQGQGHRDVCLIPVSAHGTNPASAVMAGLRVVTVKSDAAGNVDLEDFNAKAEKHKDNLSAIMITYPSTYGVFEEAVQDITSKTHECGGQVYMDGANLNAQCGLTSPGVCGCVEINQ
ncbi:glycine dehydrogenase [Aureococcus anophagefferens]|nr:glycine dehydrogenase [Aureococcus anophagefferens]